MVMRMARKTKHRKTKRRQSKRRQMKRKQTRKTYHKRERKSQKKKNLRGGLFNPIEVRILVKKLEEIGFTKEEIPDIMDKLHLGSQPFSRDNLAQIFNQTDGMNKEQFRAWLETDYALIAEHADTDYDSQLSD